MQLVEINDTINQGILGLAEPKGIDIWQTPSETIQLGTADCEDYAILKYFSALLAGYKGFVATVNLRDYGPHVVTIIQHNSNNWVLDNISKEIVTLDARMIKNGGDMDVKIISETSAKNNDPRFDKMLERLTENWSKDIFDFFAKYNLRNWYD